MIQIRKATREDLETLWNRNIAENPGEECWLRWKTQFIADNESGAAVTFAVAADGDPVGEGTLLLSPECRAIRGRLALADGKSTANINALRIRKEYEGLGHVSRLVREMERYVASLGYTRITIGAEAAESRNLAIYLHWGYDRFLLTEGEGQEIVLYYGKDLT